jgi:predicted phage-related endonuclease
VQKMTAFEEKVNAYRENKRLIEELEAMNDAVKAEIIDMMHGAPEMVQGTAKAIYKDVQSVRFDSKLLQAAHPDIYAECSKKTVYKRFSVV